MTDQGNLHMKLNDLAADKTHKVVSVKGSSRTGSPSPLTNQKGDHRVALSSEAPPLKRGHSHSHTTIFDDASLRSSPFYGFFVMFWIGVALVMVNRVLNFSLDNGGASFFRTAVVQTMQRDLVKVAATDFVMYMSMYGAYVIQRLVASGWLNWKGGGRVAQTGLEVGILSVSWVSMKLNFPWIAREFLFLHSVVMLMKVHSYGYMMGAASNPPQITIAKTDATEGTKETKASDPVEKGSPSQGDGDCKPKEALASGSSVSPPEAKSGLVSTPPKVPATNPSSNDSASTFAETNPVCGDLTLTSFFLYTMYPTVVYEHYYPRTSKIRFGYVGEKIFAIFGLIAVMITLAEVWMYPVVLKAMALQPLPLAEKVRAYPMLLLDLMPPFLLMYLLVWYLIWDAILNCIAELTRFENRNFYNAWWNSTDWSEFARDWNVPVHKFLLRHVYRSSILALRLNRTQAVIMTFLLSSLLHELAMFVIFQRLRGYLLLLQMFQLPLVALSKTRWLRERKVLGNVVFWVGIATGPSLMCTLYLTF